jgi:hypothetical protein
MRSMGRAIAVLLVALGLGLAGLFAWLGRGDARGSRTARVETSPALARAPAGSAELRGVAAPSDPRVALPSTLPRAPAESTALERPTVPAAPSRVDDGFTTRALYPDGSPEYEGGQTLDAQGRWVREGPWRAWHANGQLHELGAYHQGEETGYWKWWYENGVQMAEGNFVDGGRDGFWRYWHENGALMTECTYRGGKAHGLWHQYHPDGFKTAQGRFENGDLVGAWTVWNADGTLNLEGTGTYASGAKVGE